MLCPEFVRLLPVLGRALLLPVLPLPVLGRTLLVFLLSPEVGRAVVPVAERLPVLALIIVVLTELPVPWLPPVLGRTVVLEPVLRLLVVLPVEGRTVVLPLVERVPVVVVLLLTCGVTLVAVGRLDTL